MDNENIYDAAYSEAQLSGENETRYTFNEEIKKGNNRKRKGGMAKYIALALICSLCGGGIGSGITYYLANKNVPLNKASNNIVADPVSFAKDNTALSAADIYKKVAPAVVMISTKSIQSVNGWFQQETEGMGSGFIINTDG